MTPSSAAARQWWKIVYRRMRVSRRESLKAMRDVMTYGTGAVMIPSDGSPPYHVPVATLRNDTQ